MYQCFTWTADSSGQFWNDLGSKAKPLADAGYSAVWMPPPCKAQGGVEDIGYGIYDLYDLGEFDQKGTTRTRYGTAEQFKSCVQALNEAGLLTLADIVLNHRMGADETETLLAQRVGTTDRTQTIGEPIELEAWTRFNFPGRNDQYSDYRWRWHHFNAVDAPAEDGEERAVYRVINKNFAEDVDDELGNYDYLMGCNVHLQQPDVRDELCRWGEWFVEHSGVTGFRIDAAKHMSAGFLKEFMDHTRESSKRELYAVGEYAIADVEAIGSFIEQTEGTIQCFDFPLHYQFLKASNEGADFDLRTLFEGTLVQSQPTMAVTFVDNHDSDPAQGGDHWIKDWFKPIAYASILLRRDGFPCVYEGDCSGRNQENVPKLTSFGHDIDLLLDLRQKYNHGDQHDVFSDPNRIAWVRTGNGEHPDAMVVTASNGEAGEIKVNTFRPDAVFINASSEEDKVVCNSDGIGNFPCPAGAFAAWITQTL